MADKKVPEVRMTSFRPYLIRATYDWLYENNQTPHILVDLSVPGIDIPAFMTKGINRIVLNVSMTATAFLQMTGEGIGFNCRVGGKDQKIYIPNAAVIAVFGKETGAGQPMPMEMPDDGRVPPAVVPAPVDVPSSPTLTRAVTTSKARGHLSIVPKEIRNDDAK